MIAKKIPRDPKTDDNFGRLAEYIAAAKEEGEKLDNFWLVNSNAGEGLEDLKTAIAEIEATQSLNTRSEADKTYHLMVSFRDEKPSPEALRDMEREFALALGFDEHQRVCGTHENTDNFHLHVAYSKVHPKTLRMHTPFQDFKKLERVCRAMEKKYGLKVDRGMSDVTEKDRRPQKVKDFEANTWEQSFDTYVREGLEELNAARESAKTWDQLHGAFAERGLVIKPQGDGLVIEDEAGEHRIKPSSLGKEFGRPALEKKLGKFQRPKNAPAKSPRPEKRPPFQERMKAAADELAKAADWKEVHAVIAKQGLKIKLRGNGLAVFDRHGRSQAKASDLGRNFSKAALEKRLGAFEAEEPAKAASPGQSPVSIGAQEGDRSEEPNARSGAASNPRKQPKTRYQRKPLTKHPAQDKLWKQYLDLKTGKRKPGLVKKAFSAWKDFLLFQALDDPLAMAIIYYHKELLRTLTPERRAGLPRSPLRTSPKKAAEFDIY